MTSFQIGIVAICVFISSLDGFDVLSLAFTAPTIAREWGLAPASLGGLFSASLAGMAIGSIVLGPIADRIGRRVNAQLCLVLMSAGMLLSSVAGETTQMLVFRLLTGFGIGGMVPTINTIVAEYASAQRRDFCIGATTIGYSAGATIGGLLAIPLISHFGWRSVFLLGGLLSLVALAAVTAMMPESLQFILARRPPEAIIRMNKILARLGKSPLTSLPVASERSRSRNPIAAVVGPDFRKTTALTCSCFFFAMMTFYFLLSWFPKALVDLGLSIQGGVSGAVIMNMAGIAGGLFLGWATAWCGLRTLAIAYWCGLRALATTYMVLTFASCCVFGLIPVSGWMMFLEAFAIGFFANGTIVGLFAVLPTIYPAGVRGTGAGLAMGCGRIGAAVGPFAAGLLLAGGWSYESCFCVMALPMLLAGVFFLAIAKQPQLVSSGQGIGDGSAAAWQRTGNAHEAQA
nr:MFS transporter [Bradyrhizobium jicamae]